MFLPAQRTRRAEVSISAIKSKLPISMRTGKDVPVAAAPTRSVPGEKAIPGKRHYGQAVGELLYVMLVEISPSMVIALKR